MARILYKEESYRIIGACFEVYNSLRPGFLEIVYKDALEKEFAIQDIPFNREIEFKVEYKGANLPHSFYADFVVFDEIILEIKTAKEFSDVHLAQCLNYLKVSNLKLALLVNFATSSLEYRRIIRS